VFAGLADNPNLNLAHMKRQLNNLQVILFPCLMQLARVYESGGVEPPLKLCALDTDARKWIDVS
jgi:hypothetical protein